MYSQNWEGLQEGKEANIKGSVKRDELWLKLRRCEKQRRTSQILWLLRLSHKPRAVKNRSKLHCRIHLFPFSALNPHLWMTLTPASYESFLSHKPHWQTSRRIRHSRSDLSGWAVNNPAESKQLSTSLKVVCGGLSRSLRPLSRFSRWWAHNLLPCLDLV